jgi:hypothetical protein
VHIRDSIMSDSALKLADIFAPEGMRLAKHCVGLVGLLDKFYAVTGYGSEHVEEF